MKKLSVLMYISLACITMFSCTTTTLLNATFESDAIGSHPARNLPGAPTGDVIQYVPGVEPQLIIGNGTVTPGTTPGKALLFTNAPTVGTVSATDLWVSFKGTSTNLTNTVWIVYTAKNTGAVSPLLIDVTDGTSNLVARMRVDPNGTMALARNILDPYTDVIGNVGNDTHTVVFTLNFANLQYNVTVFRNQGSPLTFANRPMITQSVLQFVNPANPALNFSYQGTYRNVNQKYVIEEIQITKRIPDMMS
jgi:hypothetical protein